MDTFARVPAQSLVRLHMDPEGGAPVASDTAMLGVLPRRRRSTRSSTRSGRDVRTSLLMAELRQLGGALGRPHEGGGALSHLDAEFVVVRRRRSPPPRRWAPRRTPTRSG